MKKLLALVLALVMTLGLATVGANAALDDFTDGKDVNYTEAMSVMNAVGVFQGSDGKLTPKDNLTRAQAAKIIAYLNLGETGAEAMSKDVTAFSDVAAGSWAAGYISYCYNSGIVGGRGNNTFDPDANVTALEFAKMLLVTLGYDAQREGMAGDTFALNTAKLAAKNGLFDDNNSVSVNAPATREEAALYAFNALRAECVDYATASTVVEGADGLKVTVGGSSAAHYNGSGAYNGSLDAEVGGPWLQLGEKLYKGDLVLVANDAGGTDDMNRPADQWTYKTKAIGDYAIKADYTKVVAKTGKTVAEIIEDANKSATYGGSIVSLNGAVTTTVAAAAALQVGDTVEIFMTPNAVNTVKAVAVTRYIVGKLSADLATRTESGVAQIRLPGVNGLSSWTDAEDVEGYAGLVKDDIVYYYEDNGGTNGTWHVAKAESFDGQLNGIQTNSTPWKYTISGTNYQVSGSVTSVADLGATDNAGGEAAVYNTNYRYWKDANGYIIASKKLEETNKDYVMLDTLKWVGAGGSIGSSGYAQARFVKMDGTVELGKVASIDGFEPVESGAAIATSMKAGSANSGSFVTGATSALASTTDTNVGATSTAWNYYGVASGVSGATVTHKYVAFSSTATTTAGGARSALYTYKINSDGEYEFTSASKISGVNSTAITNVAAAGTTPYKASTGVLGSAGASIAVNDNTVFVVVNNPTANSPKYTVFTGKNAAPEFTDNAGTAIVGTDLMFAYASEKSVATAVFVYSYGTKNASGDWLFLASGKVGETEVKIDGSTYSYDVYKALRSGESEVISLMVDSSKVTFPNGVGLYDTLSYDSTTGALTAATWNANQSAANGVFGYNISGSTLSTRKTFGSNAYANAYNYATDTIVIYKDTDDNFDVLSYDGIATADANDQVFVALTNGTNNTTKVVYVVEKDSDAIGVTLASGLTATATTATGTVTYGTPAITYNVTTKYNGTGDNNTLTMTLAAGCQYSTDGTTWTSVSAPTTWTPNNNVIYIMAEDMSVTMYDWTV